MIKQITVTNEDLTDVVSELQASGCQIISIKEFGLLDTLILTVTYRGA